MRNVFLFIFITSLILLSCENNTFNYPITNKVEQTDNYFGVEVDDPYRWLEDENSKETKLWVEAQNQITEEYLSKISFKENIKDRIKELYNYEKISAPTFKGGYYFFLKNDGLQDHDVLFYTKSLSDDPKVILDPNKFSSDGTVALHDFSVSSDGKYLAYSISKNGSDWNEILVKNLLKNELLEDKIFWVKFSEIAWYKNGFYYSRYNEPEDRKLSKVNKFHQIYYHKIGTSQSDDELIYENKKFSNRIIVATTTSDEKYLIISESETTSGNSLHIKNLETNEKEFIKLTTSFEYEYEVIDHINGYLLIHTNYKSPKFKLIKVNINSLELGNWIDVIPEKSNVLEFCKLTGEKIIAGYIKDAYSKLEIFNLNGNYFDKIELPEIGTVEYFNGTQNNEKGFYLFNSFTMPPTVFQYNSKDNTVNTYFSPELKFDPTQFQTKQVRYRSKDGTRIPMFIVHKKGIKLDGNNPTLLYGYGGFNISILPRFSISNIIWLENGGIFTSANIRGGGEFGENWHLAGTQYNKQNVFNDFISAAKYLINESYTTSEKLAIKGGSNGGLLIGAVINQEPELFKVALPAVGVMDMLRFHKFTIGWAWVSDYGSSEDSSQFVNLYKYSPLHNISKKNVYPAVLVTTADHDDRVVPAHSYKYIATLQAKNRSDNPVLIRIQTNSGHGHGKPVSIAIEEIADILSFTFENLGITTIY